jgi:glycosyl transferase family 92
MSEEAWDRFLDHARSVLARPRFDEGYRDWKPGVATEMRRLLVAERDPDRWNAALDAVVPAREDFRDPRYDRPTAREGNWMKRWARFDPSSLWQTLDRFATAGEDPLERFNVFAKGVEKAPAEVRVSAEGIVAMGSLLNFSLTPESLPIVRPVSFGRVEQALGIDPKPAAAPAEQYANHLDFSRRMGERLEKEGFPVRDMMDVQSLIFIAGYEHEFWMLEEPAEVRVKRERTQHASGRKPYLSICAIYRNEAVHLSEWIELHRLMGVERFFLYDNRSTDDHMEVLAPYVEDGIAVLHDWPMYPGQVQAYNRCLEEHRHDSRWIAFLDLDEFLFSPTGLPVSDVLVDYERFPGVGVNWVMFGTSGLSQTPPGLVIESHLLRGREPWSFIKHIVDPERVVRCNTVHAFAYEFRTAVDENQVPITLKAGRTQFTSVARLRINHYYLRSEAEGRVKLATPKPDGGGPREFDFETLDRELSEQRDEAILRYASALQAALAKTRDQPQGNLGSRTPP